MALAIFVILNMLIAIISDAYSVCRERMQAKPKVELLQEIGLYLQCVATDMPFAGPLIEKAAKGMVAGAGTVKKGASKIKKEASKIFASSSDDEDGFSGINEEGDEDVNGSGAGKRAVAAAVRFKANGDRIITFADESDAKAASHEQSSRNSLAVHMKATDQKLTDMQGQIAAINDTLKLILSAVVAEDRREETQL